MVTTSQATLSVIVPSYNAADFLDAGLAALQKERDPNSQIIVVDDHSTDNSAAIAQRYDVQLIVLDQNKGPGPARNAAARIATGDILVFIDADVVIHPGTLQQLRSFLQHNPQVAALFGSYDAKPAATNGISQYRNLLHHYTHQSSPSEASHFWSGLGAVRKKAFWAVGGFDESHHAIHCDDIEFGYRLRDQGYLIRMAKEIQGTHLKAWHLRNMLYTDVCLRAIPWTRLLLARKEQPQDFSLSRTHRLSVLLSAAIALTLLGSLFFPALLLLTSLGIFAFGWINRGFLRFLAQQRGPSFVLAALPLHLFHSFYSGIGALLGILTYYFCRCDRQP